MISCWKLSRWHSNLGLVGLVGWLVGWLVGLVGWLVGWVGWLVGLVGWLGWLVFLRRNGGPKKETCGVD